MPSVNLEDNEWQQILFVLLKTPNLPLASEVAYPLAGKIIQQLRDKPEHGGDGRFVGKPEDNKQEKRQ